MTAIPPALQEALGGRYELVDELGRGGMAVVYRARDVRHGRVVAVKVLDALLGSVVGRDRFVREITTLASLQHPAIVPLLDSGGAGELLYYVMPLIEGESLRGRLQREAQLPLADALRLTREVAEAVDYAHAHRIVHRDIKPENILLSGGHALVTDFGIARAVTMIGGERLTQTGLAIGTPAYMSPEQAGAETQIDGRSDVYALGCVLYEMLAGEPPFTGRTAQAILARQMGEKPPSLQVVRPTVSLALQQVIERALAKVAADRYGTAVEFAAAAEQAAAAVSAPAAFPGSRLRRALGAALALAAVAIIVLRLVMPRGPALDANRVMGFPLRVQGGLPRDAGLQLAFAIGNAFPYAEPLKWADPWPYLDAAVRDDPSRLEAGTARRIARQRGAGHYVLGTVAQTPDSASVALELYDTGTDSLVARQVVAGPPSTPLALLGLRAVNALLPKILGRSTHVDETWLAERRPAAVASWLQGEVAYRHARYEEAMADYQRALGEDSGLIVAAIKGAMAATWIQEYPLGDTLVQLALRHERQLPQRSLRFARGLSFFFAGDGDSALGWFHQAVDADPEWSEGWYGVGEVYLHLIPTGSGLDSLAEGAFARSVQLDSAFAPAIFHLAQLALRRGTLADGARLVRSYQVSSNDSVRRSALEATLACVRSGPGSADFAGVARRGVEAALEAGLNLSAGYAWPACARSAFLAAFRRPGITDKERWAAVSGLHHLLVARGDGAGAMALIDSLLTAGNRWPEALLILDGSTGIAPRQRVAATLAPYLGRIDSMASGRLGFVTAWFRHLGDTARLDSAGRRFEVLAAAGGGAGDQASADAAGAWRRLLAADTADAIGRFAALRPVADVGTAAWRFWEPLAAERLQLAELLLARGRAQEAHDLAGEFDRELSINLVFLRPSLELRRRAAERLGRGGLARRYGERLAALSRVTVE